MDSTEWDLTEGLDPEGPSADDLDRFGDEMIDCASCGRRVYDGSEICPHCSGFVHRASKPAAGWVVATAVVVIVVIVLVWVL